MPLTISHYKDRQNNDTIKNNLNSFSCSQNDQYNIKKYATKICKATSKETCHNLLDKGAVIWSPVT